jgi:hypothetical protein
VTNLERPAVDGIRRELPSATLDGVLRLDRQGVSPADIAARLSISVLDVEHVLRRVATLSAWEAVRRR